jgi:hypothetical protein
MSPLAATGGRGFSSPMLTGATQHEIGEHHSVITSVAVGTIRRKIRDGKYPIAELVDQMARKLTGSKLKI